MTTLTPKMNVLAWICRLVAAGILLMTVFPKLMGAPIPVAIFTQMGIEPWGRIAIGISELVAVIFLLIPRTTWLGALIGLGVIGGAIMSHLTVLGINVHGDGGAMFMMAILVALSTLALLAIYRHDIPIVGHKIK